MKKLILLSIVFCLNACVYVDVKYPLDTDTNNTSLCDKVGYASNHSILWLVAWGDAGTQKAAESAGITKINHMDTRRSLILFGVYSKMTTIVYGE